MSAESRSNSSYRSRVGLSIDVTSPPDILELIRDAEALGVEQLWLTQISESADALTMFSAAFMQTEKINLGTSIVPVYPLHPLALAQQAHTVGALANGRLRLGVGPSTKSRVKRIYGLEMESPLAFLGEYIAILEAVLTDGTVNHTGRFFTANVTMDNPAPQVPVLASALGAEAFRQAGRIAHGAISWNCPPAYLTSIAIPALSEGAESVERSVPPLIAHACVVQTTDRRAALAAGRQHLSFYVRHPFYAAMFAAAGHPIPDDLTVPEGLIDSLIIAGTDDEIARRLVALLDSGPDELLISNLPLDADRHASDRRLLALIAAL